MFTGIIETVGEVESVRKDKGNVHITIRSSITPELQVDQSIAHNGTCLTVVEMKGSDSYVVTAIDETLKRTNLGSLTVGSKVNLERCMPATGRFDGHIVQGHVDQVATVSTIDSLEGSTLFSFIHDAGPNFTVEKGSVCINGVSLTAFNTSDTGFTVAIIPYTFENTCFGSMKLGDKVNLEFDILGKYVSRMMERG